jgi:hypothetical protein
MLNFEEYSFPLVESVPKTLSGYQAERPDFLFRWRVIRPDLLRQRFCQCGRVLPKEGTKEGTMDADTLAPQSKEHF